MGDSETLYEKVTTKLKNNKAVVALLIAFGVILGLAQLQGALSGLFRALFPEKTRIEVSASINQYDFMTEKNEIVKSFAPTKWEITQVQEAAADLAKEVVSAIGPSQKGFEVNLRIDGNNLRASRHVQASVIVVSSPMAQVGRMFRNIGETDTLDLQALSADPQLLNPRGDVIKMEFGALSAGLDRVPVSVFKHGGGFSFNHDTVNQTRVIQFPPHKIKLILEKFEVRGERAQNAGLSLDSTLRRTLSGYPFLEVSPDSIADLRRKRAELEQNLTPGIGKSALANQSSVDYVITGNVIPE
jgi:hypothetical protein